MRRGKTRTLGRMALLAAVFFSPLAMVVVAALAVGAARFWSLPKLRIGTLIWMSVGLAVVGAASSLIFTIAWMTWYERTTGISAGNGPLGWIFFYGPASVASGQFLALMIWWFRKVPSGSINAA
jgi:hypothetical protein